MSELYLALGLVALVVMTYRAGWGQGYKDASHECTGGGWEDEALQWRELIAAAAEAHILADVDITVEGTIDGEEIMAQGADHAERFA
jgi:hypothetical protein